MRRLLVAAVVIAGCRGDGGHAGVGSGSASAPVVRLRARPADVTAITIKALGIT